LLREFVSRKITLIIPSQGIDTSKVPRKAFLGMLDAIEEYRRAATVESVRAGLAAARKRGARLGRPQTVNAHRGDVARLRARGLTGRAIAKELGIPSSTVFKLIKGMRGSLATPGRCRPVSRQPRSDAPAGRQVTLPGVRIRFPSVAKNGHWRAPAPQEEGCDKSRRTLKLYQLAPLAISCRSMASSRESARPRVRRDSRAVRTFSTRVCADAALIASGRAFSMGPRRLQSP